MTQTDPPDDIALVSAKDPETMTDTDLDKLIAHHRQQRALREAGVIRRVRKPAAAKATDLDLSDLGWEAPAANLSTLRRL